MCTLSLHLPRYFGELLPKLKASAAEKLRGSSSAVLRADSVVANSNDVIGQPVAKNGNEEPTNLKLAF